MITLCLAICRARPATKPVSPARAPLLMPSSGIGDFTDADVMLTMRPNLRVDHAVDHRLDQQDRRQHVGIDRLDPVVAAPFAEVAARRAAGVVDQDVRLRAGRERRRAACVGGDVAGDGRHLDAGLLADFLGGPSPDRRRCAR